MKDEPILRQSKFVFLDVLCEFASVVVHLGRSILVVSAVDVVLDLLREIENSARHDTGCFDSVFEIVQLLAIKMYDNISQNDATGVLEESKEAGR